jgi:hypothetical protein
MIDERNGLFIALAFAGGVFAWKTISDYAQQHLTPKQTAIGAVFCLGLANLHDWDAQGGN